MCVESIISNTEASIVKDNHYLDGFQCNRKLKLLGAMMHSINALSNPEKYHSPRVEVFLHAIQFMPLYTVPFFILACSQISSTALSLAIGLTFFGAVCFFFHLFLSLPGSHIDHFFSCFNKYVPVDAELHKIMIMDAGIASNRLDLLVASEWIRTESDSIIYYMHKKGIYIDGDYQG